MLHFNENLTKTGLLAEALRGFVIKELSLYVESAHARVASAVAKLLFDPEKLVVLCNTLGSARCACLDLAGVESNCEVSDSCIRCFTGAVRRNSCVTSLVSHLDSFESLGYGTDLVELDEDRVACSEADALSKSLCICNEQVVAYELYLAADLGCHLYPAVPVLFIETVLDRDDRVLFNKSFPVSDKLVCCEVLAALGLMIETLALFALPLGSGSVHSDHEILAGLETCSLDSFEDLLDSVFIALELVRSETALVAYSGNVAHLLDESLKIVENFRTPAETFLERRSADRHDHEFLSINSAVCVSAAVENVHHRNGELGALNAAEESVKRDIESGSRSSCTSDRNCKYSVCAELGLVLGAVELDHLLIYCVCVACVHTDKSVCDNVIDVVNCLLYALAEVSALIAVTQLKSLKFTGGSAAGSGSSCNSTVCKLYLSFNGRISSGVEYFSSLYVYDFQINHDKNSFCLVCIRIQTVFLIGTGTPRTHMIILPYR